MSKEGIITAKLAIITGFRWAKTPQGADYWNEVYENLKNLEKTARSERVKIKIINIGKIYTTFGEQAKHMRLKKWKAFREPRGNKGYLISEADHLDFKYTPLVAVRIKGQDFIFDRAGVEFI